MKEFSILLEQAPLPIDESKADDIFTYLESFMFVLEKWSEGLESNKDDKTNFLDTSLTSDLKTIVTMWTTK